MIGQFDDDIHTGYRYIGTVRTDREWVNSKRL